MRECFVPYLPSDSDSVSAKQLIRRGGKEKGKGGARENMYKAVFFSSLFSLVAIRDNNHILKFCS